MTNRAATAATATKSTATTKSTRSKSKALKGSQQKIEHRGLRGSLGLRKPVAEESGMDFYVVDVETANADHASICQVGIVRVVNGVIVDEFVTLVDPEAWFDSRNIEIHGITPHKVENQPTMPAVLERLRRFLSGAVSDSPDVAVDLADVVLVSHMPFDKVALHRAAVRYGIEPLPVVWLDSAKIVRRAWQEKYARRGFGLKNVAKDLDISFVHHDALDDARAAAQIVLEACTETGFTIEGWLEQTGAYGAHSRSSQQPKVSGKFASGGGLSGLAMFEKPVSSPSSRATRKVNPQGVLSGETVVFTGRLSLVREKAADIAMAAGCDVDKDISERTTLLVVGIQNQAVLAGYEKSRKHRQAEKLLEQGADLRILSENDFAELIKPEFASAFAGVEEPEEIAEGTKSKSTTRERYSFGNLKQILEMPDLIAIQSKSFSKFLNEGLAQAFRDISPITDYSGMLQLELELELEDEDLLPPPKFTVEECKEKDMTYSSPVFARARFLNGHTGEIKEQVVFMGDFPKMTDYGTFIINGTERVVVSQLVRSPGVIFQPGERYRLRNFAKHQLVTGTIHPYRGEWVEFDVEQRPHKEVTAGARVARKRRLPLFTLLRALGYGEERHPNFLRDFVDHFDFLEEQWDKQAHIGPTQTEALIEIYKRVRPGEPATAETARSYFERAFFTPRRYDLSRVGRHKLNRKLKAELEFLNETFGLGLREADPDNPDATHPELSLPHPDQSHLSPCEMLATASYMLNLAKGEPGYRLDDQDHFANRRIRSVGELIQNQVRIGLTRMERVVRDRMTTQELEAMTPQTLINIRSVVTALKEFFGSSQLSQFMDQTNPLAGLIHRRRISALGPGGLSRERAGFEVRDVHFSHYGRMCPIETPEGPNIGLIGALASFARINDHGFIESPYRIVEDGKATDQVVYLDADDEEEYVIAQANAPIDDQGNFEHERVLARLSPQATSLQDLRLQLERDVFFGATTEITFVSPTEVQMMDISPQQIVSVATALIPFLEHNDANRALMGANMQRQAVPLIISEAPYVGTGVEGRTARDAGDVVTAAGKGVVSSLSAGHIEVDYDEWGYVEVPLRKFERSNQDTCVNQKPLVRLGDEVEKGDILADGPSTDHGELALGKNLMVAFMPWEGYNFEDAIVLSERLVRDDVLTSVHIHEYEIDARDTKLGVEEITRDIPNLSEDILADLDRRGIVRIGAEVEPGDVLVGKVTPKGETELSGEERLLRAIFGDKARDVRDNSLKVPHGEGGKVVDVKVFDRDDNHELPPGVNQLVRVYVAQIRKISVGDKLAGRHGNKGVISRILPMEDMPFTADGTPVDIILNPLGVPSRMNVGQVLEAHLGYCARWGWKTDGEQVGDEPVRGTERKTRPSSPPSCFVATPVFDGAVWDEKTKSPDNPTIVDILSNINPESADGQRLIGIDGKQTLYNGRTGEPYDTPITTGYVYVLKLAHLVDDKIHARSTGPYSMIHQQPLGGKAQFGGQRFGEMEVWALEAYGAAYCLQELLTLKSDDVAGRARVYEAIVKGKNVPEPGIPESFRVLIKEMQSLCLNVEVLSSNGMEMQLHELDEDSLSNLADLGISLHRPERGSDKEDKTREATLVGTSR